MIRASVLVVLALLAAAPARAQEFSQVVFRSADRTEVPALLGVPSGRGPHPAVVLLHGCGGRDNRAGQLQDRHAEWAELLRARGYAVLLPESFAARGQGSQCGVRDRAILPWRERRADAIGARIFLAGQPGIDPQRIALLGWSHGGSTVLASADAGADPSGYAAFVAFYPGCTRVAGQAGWTPSAPLLLLVGAADDWTPAHPCRALANAAGPRIALVDYPGAFHGFDAPNQPLRLRTGLAFTARGDGTAHVGTDPAARADALARVPAWLDARLGPGRGPGPRPDGSANNR